MKRKKKAYLFGFRKSDPDEIGYLAVGENGYSVTKDRASAFSMDLVRPRGARGWAPPSRWLEFFASEVPDWKFHIVDFYV